MPTLYKYDKTTELGFLKGLEEDSYLYIIIKEFIKLLYVNICLGVRELTRKKYSACSQGAFRLKNIS